MKKLVTRAEFNELQRLAKRCMRLASTHDLEHATWIQCTSEYIWFLSKRLAAIEKQITAVAHGRRPAVLPPNSVRGRPKTGFKKFPNPRTR